MAERTIWWSLWALLLLNISPTADAADSHSKQHDATVARAVRLLPTRPEKVVIVDVDQVPALRAKLSHAEAFVTHGERVVYLRMQGQMLQQATRTGGFFDYALAAIIWHEMAHIDGADEAAALAAEQALWRQYIVQRRVDAAAGLRYLSTICSHEAAHLAERIGHEPLIARIQPAARRVRSSSARPASPARPHRPPLPHKPLPLT